MVDLPVPTKALNFGGLSVVKVPCPASYATGGFVADVGQIRGDIGNVVVNAPDSDMAFHAIALKMPGSGYENWLKFRVFMSNGIEVPALTDLSAVELAVLFTKSPRLPTSDLPDTPPVPPATVPEQITGMYQNYDTSHIFDPTPYIIYYFSWDPPADGGSPITEYIVTKDGGEVLPHNIPPDVTHGWNVYQGDPLVHTMTVRAVNAVGPGPVSADFIMNPTP